ncbi:MAG: NAD(P)/FAD-dependent oxidoreductase [Myxococcota bacterium]
MASPVHVVIVGGGFAGLEAAKVLSRAGDDAVAVTLVDRRNHHLFQPLLYQVAMAGLSPADITMPIRTVVKRYTNVSVRLATVTAVRPDDKCIETSEGPLSYDYLILAGGATHAYFGHDEWEPFAPGLKTIEQATEIRRRVLTAFEQAELEKDSGRQRELLTFIVVGAGPTGVELAGALGELSRFTLTKDFRRIDPSRTRVILIEGGPRVLPAFSDEQSRDAARSLEKLGVTVWTDARVTGVDAEGVWVGEERVQASNVLWAAGVRASGLNAHLGGELDRAGRVSVERDLSLPGHPEVFVVGDQARIVDEQGEQVPGVAPAAIQSGRTAAENIVRDLKEVAREEFAYFDKGLMATIGRANAVVESGNFRASGFVAWLAWCFVHILYLIGFRNRVLVFLQWIYSYFRYRRGARLITERTWMLDEPPPPVASASGSEVEGDAGARPSQANSGMN